MKNLFEIIAETRAIEAAKPESERAFRLTKSFGDDVAKLVKGATK